MQREDTPLHGLQAEQAIDRSASANASVRGETPSRDDVPRDGLPRRGRKIGLLPSDRAGDILHSTNRPEVLSIGSIGRRSQQKGARVCYRSRPGYTWGQNVMMRARNRASLLLSITFRRCRRGPRVPWGPAGPSPFWGASSRGVRQRPWQPFWQPSCWSEGRRAFRSGCRRLGPGRA